MELSKKLRERNAEIESLKSRHSKLECELNEMRSQQQPAQKGSINRKQRILNLILINRRRENLRKRRTRGRRTQTTAGNQPNSEDETS